MAPTAAILLMASLFTLASATDYKNDNQRRLDVANRLLALLKTDRIDLGPGGTARSAANGGLVPPEAADSVVKNVLELLTGHSGTHNSLDDQRLTFGDSDTLRSLNAMLIGKTKTPPPIDLNSQHPSQAVMGYMDALGIPDDNCKSRTICELLVEPQAGFGIFGELVSYVFGSENADQITLQTMGEERFRKFQKAAQDGRRMVNCAEEYAACKTSYKSFIRVANLN